MSEDQILQTIMHMLNFTITVFSGTGTAKLSICWQDWIFNVLLNVSKDSNTLILNYQISGSSDGPGFNSESYSGRLTLSCL